MSLAERLAGLDGIGVSASGVTRLAWTEEAAATRAWFEQQAAAVGLSSVTDPAGNLWACPAADPPWYGVGSHLDSVRAGGRFDGPLGVACGFELAAASDQPVAVISFADEEGARWGTPTFGSKALAGRLDLPSVLERRDEQGVSLSEAMAASGVDPAGLPDAPAWREKLSAFVEVHIDQTTDVARAGAPVGVVSALASRMRLEVEVHGRADHAGTTPRDERRDAMVDAARLIVAADQLASENLTVTIPRIVAQPNAPTTIASGVRLWIDARSSSQEQLDACLAQMRRLLPSDAELTVASRSPGRPFSPQLRSRLARAGATVVGAPLPEVVCFAGHDAGVIAEHLPAAMLLVRNDTGVSHSPQEDVDLADAEVAVAVVREALEAVV